MEVEFKEWPKIPRWSNESYVITEKIDGTNGCIIVTDHGDVFAQSRSRILDESSSGDNYGFCKWVYGNKDDLLRLGVGYHYGEWWGQGIQRNYGLTEKKFSLFNIWHPDIPECVDKVPVVEKNYEKAWNRLKEIGSVAAPGFMKPEGFVMSATQNRGVRYKVLFD
jgi:RNA ligase